VPVSASDLAPWYAFQAEFSAKAIRGLMARRRAADTSPPHGPPGSGAGCHPPHAVLTKPVAALVLYRDRQPAIGGALISLCLFQTAPLTPPHALPSPSHANTHSVVSPSGRFLIRPSDSLFLAPQSDFEKKQNTARKSSARNAQIRGLFAPTPKAEDFLSDTRHKNFRAASLASELKFRRKSSLYFVSLVS
jgi:hypothetical protein